MELLVDDVDVEEEEEEVEATEVDEVDLDIVARCMRVGSRYIISGPSGRMSYALLNHRSGRMR